jgi:toxin YoeB
VVVWKVALAKQAQKDAKKLSASGLKDNAKDLLEILKVDPFKAPPPYEALKGNLNGYFSRRINIKHRMVYQVLENERAVKVLRMWAHSE